MGRIRTIKPEFPKSETIGSLSRDARLLFIQLWTEADDAGRLRGASRLLASVLYPYDEDAPALIEAWLSELAEKGCIRRYRVNGNQYIEIANWLEHQKIDRPSPSRLPSFNEGSEIPREGSRGLDDGPRTLDLGPVPRTEDRKPAPAARPPSDEELALEAYNATAKRFGWPLAQKLNETRRRSLKARLDECKGIEPWRAAMTRAARSDFLTGRAKRAGTHEGWNPNLDFFLQASSFTKLIEGFYDNKGSAPPPEATEENLHRVWRTCLQAKREGRSWPSAQVKESDIPAEFIAQFEREIALPQQERLHA